MFPFITRCAGMIRIQSGVLFFVKRYVFSRITEICRKNLKKNERCVIFSVFLSDQIDVNFYTFTYIYF